MKVNDQTDNVVETAEINPDSVIRNYKRLCTEEGVKVAEEYLEDTFENEIPEPIKREINDFVLNPKKEESDPA